jgi:hypothetical protein
MFAHEVLNVLGSFDRSFCTPTAIEAKKFIRFNRRNVEVCTYGGTVVSDDLATFSFDYCRMAVPTHEQECIL